MATHILVAAGQRGRISMTVRGEEAGLVSNAEPGGVIGTLTREQKQKQRCAHTPESSQRYSQLPSEQRKKRWEKTGEEKAEHKKKVSEGLIFQTAWGAGFTILYAHLLGALMNLQTSALIRNPLKNLEVNIHDLLPLRIPSGIYLTSEPKKEKVIVAASHSKSCPFVLVAWDTFRYRSSWICYRDYTLKLPCPNTPLRLLWISDMWVCLRLTAHD